MTDTIELCKMYSFFISPNLRQRTVTLRGDYLYQIVHLCIINLTEGAT